MGSKQASNPPWTKWNVWPLDPEPFPFERYPVSYMIFSHYQISMAFVFFLLQGGWDHLLRQPQARLWDSLLEPFFGQDSYIPKPKTKYKPIQVMSEEHLAIWLVLKFMALLVCYFHVFKQDNLASNGNKHSKVVKQFEEIL